eukprot:500669_1
MTKRASNQVLDAEPPPKRRKLNVTSEQCLQIKHCQDYLRYLLRLALIAIKHRTKINNLESFNLDMPRVDTIFKYYDIIKQILKSEGHVSWDLFNVTIENIDRIVPQSFRDKYYTPSNAFNQNTDKPAWFANSDLYLLYVGKCSSISHSYCSPCDGLGIRQPYKLCKTCDGHGHATHGGFVCPKCEEGIVEIPCDEEDCLQGCEECNYSGTIHEECSNCNGKWRRYDCPHCSRTGNFLWRKMKPCHQCHGSGIKNEEKATEEASESDISSVDITQQCINTISNVAKPEFEQYKHKYVNKLDRYQSALDRYIARVQKKYKEKYAEYSIDSVSKFISNELVHHYLRVMAKKYMELDQKTQKRRESVATEAQEVIVISDDENSESESSDCFDTETSNTSTPLAIEVVEVLPISCPQTQNAIPQLEQVDPPNDYKEPYMSVLRENNELKLQMDAMKIEFKAMRAKNESLTQIDAQNKYKEQYTKAVRQNDELKQKMKALSDQNESLKQQLQQINPQNEYKAQYLSVLAANDELKQQIKGMEIESEAMCDKNASLKQQLQNQSKTIQTLKNVLKTIHDKKNKTVKDLNNVMSETNRLRLISSALEAQMSDGCNPRIYLVNSAKCDDWIERTETVKKWKDELNEQHEMEIDQYKQDKFSRSMIKNISKPCRVPNMVGSFGVRAKMNIPKDIVLCRYVGFEMTNTEWAEVFDFSNEEALNGMYLYSFELDDKRSITIDPIYGGKKQLAGLYINDCRKDINISQRTQDDIHHQNCQFKVTLWKGWPIVFIVTIKDISKGQELLVDYSAAYWAAMKVTNRWVSISKRMKELCKKHIVKNTNIHAVHNGVECHDLTL